MLLFLKGVINILLSKTATVYWNSRNKKRFVELGYQFTKMFEPFEAKVEDLSPGSNALVLVQCDFCGKVMEKTFYQYNAYRKITQVDSCNSPQCEYQKAKMSMESIYGTDNIRSVDFLEEKRKQTLLEKYGVDNPFANDEIKKKIRETNMEKYGVPYTMQNPEIQEKSKKTCLEKYGVESYIYFLQDNKGEKSPCWKGGHPITPRDRRSYEYTDWRRGVFARDDFTCQRCGARSGNGHTVILVGHHILNWVDHEALRYEIDNGITLCEECHRAFHKKYGVFNNTREQIEEFICKDEKIC